MSPDEMTEMADLDDLSRRLEAAGRRAERALPRDPAREQEIVGRLRAQLLGEAAELEDDDSEHRLIALRPMVRTRVPAIRISRSLLAGLAACLVVVGVAAAAPIWLPQLVPSPTATATATGTASSTEAATLAPLVEPSTSPAPELSYGPAPSPPESTGPTGSPTPTLARKPTAAPTPTPTGTATATPVPVDMGPLNVTANANGTYTITWTAFPRPQDFTSYALCYTTNENASFGYIEHFGGAIGISKTAISWTGTFPWAATLKVKIEALYYPSSGAAQKAGETHVVVIPYTGATPTPTPTPTATPTPPPVVNLGDFLNVQDNGGGTYTFTWTAYTGPLSVTYVISATTTASGSFGYAESLYDWIHSAPSPTWTGSITSGSWRIKVEAISTSTGSVVKAAETNIYFITIP